MANKWELKDGQLSAYALLCGYQQEVKTDSFHIIMFLDGDYQIEVFDINNAYNRVYRKSFDHSLMSARKAFKSLVKAVTDYIYKERRT